MSRSASDRRRRTPRKKSPKWLDEFTYQDVAGRRWLTITAVVQRFKLPRNSVERWGNRKRGSAKCRYLLDARGERRFIESKKVAKVAVYLEADIEAVAAARKTSNASIVKIGGERRFNPAAVHIDDLGQRWLTEVQLNQKHGVKRGFLLSKYTNAKDRPGKSLRSKSIPNPSPKGPADVDVFLEKDALDLIAGTASTNPGAGKGANADRRRDERLTQAKQEAIRALPNQKELPTGELVALVAKQAAVGSRTARRAIELTTIARTDPSGKTLRRLAPGQSIPSAEPLSEAGANRKVHPDGKADGSRDVGRPPSDEIRKRNDHIRRDWQSKKFDRIADLARHYHVSRGRASNIVHGRE